MFVLYHLSASLITNNSHLMNSHHKLSEMARVRDKTQRVPFRAAVLQKEAIEWGLHPHFLSTVKPHKSRFLHGRHFGRE